MLAELSPAFDLAAEFSIPPASLDTLGILLVRTRQRTAFLAGVSWWRVYFSMPSLWQHLDLCQFLHRFEISLGHRATYAALPAWLLQVTRYTGPGLGR